MLPSVVSPGTGRPIPSSSRNTTGPFADSVARWTAAAIAESAPAIVITSYFTRRVVTSNTNVVRTGPAETTTVRSAGGLPSTSAGVVEGGRRRRVACSYAY